MQRSENIQGRKLGFTTKDIVRAMRAMKWPKGQRGLQSELAYRLGVSPATVRYHLKKAGILK